MNIVINSKKLLLCLILFYDNTYLLSRIHVFSVYLSYSIFNYLLKNMVL